MQINDYPKFYCRLNPNYYESMRTRSALLPEQNPQGDSRQERKTKQQAQKVKNESSNHASEEIAMSPEDEKSPIVLGDINDNDIADENSVAAAEVDVHSEGSKVVYTDVDAERDVMDDSVDETNGENTNNNNTEEGVSNEDDKDDIKKDLSEKEISLKVTDADDDVATDLSTKTQNDERDDTNDETPSFTEQKKDDESTSDTPSNPIPAKFAFPGGIPGFPTNPSALLSGQLQSNFARSLSAQFYSSLSMLASQAMLNVKEEPKDANNNYQSYHHQSSPENMTTQTTIHDDVQPERTSSRNSLDSNQSFDENCPNNRGSPPLCPISFSSTLSGGSEAPQRPLSELSPKALAEQLRNNDSASMVVCRQQKFPARSAGYAKQHYSSSGGGTPPPAFPTLTSSNNESYSGGLENPTTNSNSSPSLHHFTTRYTIEMPSDPSRLGVELILDHDNAEPVIEVECGGNRGLLYVNKLCQGSKGQSILFNDEWLTPNEFQFISGRETAKDWKRSIRHCGKSLKTLMTKGILQVHPPVCECQLCRGAQGSKILANKKNLLKDNSKKIKSSPTPETKLSPGFDTSMMMRPGFDGGLSSIISQLHKANGFETNGGSETLDLTTKSSWDRSSSPSPRKHHRDDSFLEQKMSSSRENGSSSSPVQKRSHSENEEDHNFDGSTFPSTYPYLPPEEQYRRMMALLNRSLSPGDPQFPLYNMPSLESLRFPTANFPDLTALQTAFQLESNLYDNRERGKTKSHYNEIRKESNAFDLSRNMKDRTDCYSRKRDFPFSQSHSKNHGNKNEKYRKSDRNYSPLDGRRSRPDLTKQNSHGYIALESRSRGTSFNNPGSNHENFRGWPNHTLDLGYRRQDPVIDLNVSSSSSSGRVPDWNSKLSPSWSSERSQVNKKLNDWKRTSGHGTISPGRKTNGTFHGPYPDQHIILDRIPINKNPVTTLHHRPNFNHDNEPPSYPHHTQRFGSSKSTISHRYDNRSKQHMKESRSSRSPSAECDTKTRMPMLDLHKHAVPVVSLTSSSIDKNMESCKIARNDLSDRDTGFGEMSSRRQSSSAPPPRLLSRDDHRVESRPKSAQDVVKSESFSYDPNPQQLPITTSSLFLRQKTNSRRNSSSRYRSQSCIPSTEQVDWKYSNLLTERNRTIQQALNEMHSWTVDEVCAFVRKIDPAFENYTEEFKRHELDGEGLPLLTEHHLMDLMKMKLGQALKIVAHVKRFLTIYADTVTCCHRSLLCNDLLLTPPPKMTEKVVETSTNPNEQLRMTTSSLSQ